MTLTVGCFLMVLSGMPGAGSWSRVSTTPISISAQSIPADQILSAKVDYTIVGGRVVYRRDGIE